MTTLALAIFLVVSSSFSPVQYGTYVQLTPGNNKKIVFQIIPDKTYANVVAHINFYSADNKRVGQKAFSITEGKDKYIRKNECTNKVFKFSFDKAVARVTIDHINEGEILDPADKASAGTRINLPVSKDPLGPIEK